MVHNKLVHMVCNQHVMMSLLHAVSAVSLDCMHLSMAVIV
jgi:hypothetical protein